MVRRTRIDDQAFKLMVSVPHCVWTGEMTALGRTQVRTPPAPAFQMTVGQQNSSRQLNLIFSENFAMHETPSIDMVTVGIVSGEPVEPFWMRLNSGHVTPAGPLSTG